MKLCDDPFTLMSHLRNGTNCELYPFVEPLPENGPHDSFSRISSIMFRVVIGWRSCRGTRVRGGGEPSFCRGLRLKAGTVPVSVGPPVAYRILEQSDQISELRHVLAPTFAGSQHQRQLLHTSPASLGSSLVSCCCACPKP